MNNPELFFIPLQNFSDDRGNLNVLGLPDFQTKRFFWIKSVDPSLKRGGHGHKDCSQILFAIAGKVELEIVNSDETQICILDEFSGALHIPPGYWVSMTFKDADSILGIVANKLYDENDYFYVKPK